MQNPPKNGGLFYLMVSKMLVYFVIVIGMVQILLFERVESYEDLLAGSRTGYRRRLGM